MIPRQRARLGDLVETQKGYAFKSGWYCNTGRPIVKVSNFTDDSVDNTELVCIPESTAVDYLKYELRTGDVVVQTVGSWPTNPASVVGKCIRIPRKAAGALLNQNAVRLTPTGDLDKTFLFYVLRNEDFKAYIIGTAQGAASQAAITLESIRGYEIELPPLPIQRRIASILSAYDELIENSQRRIKILESMARGLYREWFVHFRFPGHENQPRVPSSLGEIPKGWEVTTLSNFVQFKSGYAFKSGTFTTDGCHRLVTIKNVQDGVFSPESDSRISELPANLPPYCVLDDGDILLSLTGNVGRVCLVYGGAFLLNQRVCKLVPVETFDWAMTYCIFRETEMRGRLEQISNGVAQQNLSPVLASKMDFIRPRRELRQQFAVLVEPILRRVVQLYVAIQNLRRTRDLLLPRLLSGQVDLKEV